MRVDRDLPLQLTWLQKNHRQTMNRISYLDLNPTGNKIVLLLHGLGTNGLSWGYQSLALAEAGFRPLAVDIPGFGQSPAPIGGRWTIDAVTAELSDLLTSLNGAPAHVVGLSLGGTVAQIMALNYPHQIDRLVLANTFACLRPKKAGEWAYLLRRFLIANLRGAGAQAETVAWRIFPRPEQDKLRELLITTIRSTNPEVYRAAMRSLIFYDTRARLKSIQVPTLVISGTADTTVGMPVQTELASLIPGARHAIIQGAGHAAPVDHPDLFNQILLDFLTVEFD